MVIPMSYRHVFAGENAELADFACRFLEDRDALLESSANRVNVLIPSNLCNAIGLPEYFSVTGQPEGSNLPESGKLYPIHFGSRLLEQMTEMAGLHPPLLNCELKFTYIKTTGFENLVREQFDFFKATGSVFSTGEIRKRYVVLTCKYVVQSDEVKEGLIAHAFDFENGVAVPDMAEQIEHSEKMYPPGSDSVFTREQVDRLLDRSGKVISQKVESKIVDFKNSMNRRFRRDMKSLNEYYHALEGEMRKSMERTGLSEKLLSERKEKIALIPTELSEKKKDLLNKYSIRAKASLAAAMVVTTPAVNVLFRAKAGRQKRELIMTYNPVTKQIDPLCCESCGCGMYRIAFSDSMRLVCKLCQDQRS